jgi:hypothetical protein
MRGKIWPFWIKSALGGSLTSVSSSHTMTRAPRIPGKRVVWISGRPVTLTDAQYKDMMGMAEGKRRPGLKRAADKAWEALAGKDRAK